MPKDRLVSLLWGRCPPKSAKATLETYVCALRKALRTRPQAHARLITTVAGGYALDMGCVDLDLTRYERLTPDALQPDVSATEALPMLQQAMTLALVPPAPREIGSPWLNEVRQIHNQDVHKARIAAAETVAGLPCRSAEQWARLAREQDPLDETAWRPLLQNLEANGAHADGLQAYDQCRSLFAAELNCAPGPGLQVLYVRLLRASEDGEELSGLLDDLVGLHMARRSGAQPPKTRGTAITRSAPAASIEQVDTALSRLEPS